MATQFDDKGFWNFQLPELFAISYSLGQSAFDGPGLPGSKKRKRSRRPFYLWEHLLSFPVLLLNELLLFLKHLKFAGGRFRCLLRIISNTVIILPGIFLFGNSIYGLLRSQECVLIRAWRKKRSFGVTCHQHVTPWRKINFVLTVTGTEELFFAVNESDKKHLF